MKRHLSLFTLAIFLGVLSSLWVFVQAQAQIDAFTFFIPYHPNDLNAQFKVNNNSYPGTDVDVTISISVLRDNTIIYYDHGEDGLETTLTFPNQPTTEIWGDGDPTNGAPPNIPGDILNANDVIVLQNTVETPRDPADLFFDGGDKLTATGGSIAVTLAAWPNGTGTLYAGAWELYPTSRWGTDYMIPVGENLAGDRGGFEVVGLNVQAVEDNTTVNIDLDADGTFETTTTLNQGEQIVRLGGVLSGARVQASNPVQVHIFTTDPRATYEARAYTMVPFNQWTDDYLAPRSSDGDYWLYNPDTNELQVEATTSTGAPTIVTIPPMRTTRYPTTAGMSPATGVRFTSTDGRPFYGLVALDPDSARDWGYSLLPINNLTTQSLIGWGPGNINPTPDGDQSRVYVTAITTTTLTVRYATGVVANFTIPPLAEVPITAPNHDMTGAFLYTSDGTPFISVWGQDSSAEPGTPSIDVGTNIVPLASLAIQKTVNLIDDADGTGTVTWGDTVEYTLLAYNNSANPLNNAVIEDNLPPSLSYVANTGTVDGASIPDDSGGATIFPFDEGGYNVGTINGLEEVRISFHTIILDGYFEINNRATVDADNAPPPVDPGGVIIPLAVARYELDKRLISPPDGMSAAGQVVTFGLTITSTGNISITRLPLRDTFNEDHLTFLQAIPAPDTTAPGEITWNDLATSTLFGPLEPGRVIDLIVAFTVDQIPSTVTHTINVATVEGAQGIDGSPLPPATDDAEVNFVPLAAQYLLDKRLISPPDGMSAAGQVITFGLTITSTGNISITRLPLRDTFNEDHLTFLQAIPAPDTSAPGEITWHDLAASTFFGPLEPGRAIDLTVAFTVDHIPPTVLETMNIARVEGAAGNDGIVLPPAQDTAGVIFQFSPAPDPEPNPGSKNKDKDDDDDDPGSSPPPAAPQPPVQPTTVLPVLFLPETGMDAAAGPAGVWLVVPFLGATLLVVYLRRRTKKTK